MPFNWFDFVVLIVLAVGVLRGRKRGMSEELLTVIQWVTIVVVSGLSYRPIGRMVADSTNLTLLTAYIGSYLCVVVAIKFLFTWIKKGVGEKLVGSDIFGASEFYLGMVAGMVRFACMLLAILALLHAKLITTEQRARLAKVQKDNFGDISFPTFGSVQYEIFQGSMTGRFLEKTLSTQLIEPTAPGQKLVQTESLRSRRDRELDEISSSKK